MNRSLHNTENPSINGSDQAHSAWSSYARAAQQQATRPPPQTQPYSKNSPRPKQANADNYNAGSVQLPAAPSTNTVIQFGSVNQSPQGGKTGDVPALSHSPSASPVDSQRANIRPNTKPEISRSPRSTTDGRLFTQPYAPHRDLNQDYAQNRHYNKGYQPRQMGGYQQQQYHGYTQPSPQQQPMPIHHRSPNMPNYTKKSPHLPNSSPQPAWAASGQYYYSSPHYQMPAFVPPISPAIKKGIPIINPETGTTLPKDEKPSFFKPPGPGSKRLTIVDPSTKDSEAREKKEREDAELAAAAAAKEKRKQEEEEKERLEKERLEKERLEKERLEKERLEKERLEKERLEQERLEQERLEQERLEQERLEKERLEREEKEKKEKERLEREEKERLAVETQKKKDQEQKELDHNRVIRKAEEDELKRQEAKKKEVEVASQKLGRPPNPIDISPIPAHLTQSPVSSPVSSPVEKPRVVTRVLEDPSTVEYPSHVTAAPTKSKKELGKLVYETEFLMQFQGLCLQTTADLSVMKELMESVNNKSNSNMQRRQTSERNRSGRNHGGDAMFKMGSRDGNRMEMGKFNMGRPLTSRTASGYNEQLASGGSGRGGSSRGRGGMKVTRNPPQIQGAPTIPIDQVTPLEKSENRWVPISDSGTPAVPGEGELVPKEVIIRKVNALLNKLTLEKFDSISQQIFDYANQSIQEEDGKSLRTVIRLMFEKACDEPAFAAMWARLARFIHDKISDQVIDINITGKDGKPVKGKALYRKYLLNRCQIEFEKGWKVNMPEVKDGEMLTDEYYAAAKAKRQGLGLIAYIGEAYKMDMLSHKIMLGCFARLCVDPGNISDEEAESLCKLIRTAGQKFDRETTSQRWMEALINRIKEEMMFSPNISSRIKFMLQDILDLRQNKWVLRGNAAQAGPMTIAKIHEMAEKANEEKESAMKRGNSNRGNFIPNNNHNNHNMSRTGSHRGGGRDYQSFKSNYNNNKNSNSGGDGWNTVGNTSPGPTSKTRVSELSNFGKLDRSRSKSSTLGPSNSPFASLSKNKSFSENKESSEGRASPARNMFSALLGGREDDKREESPAASAPEASSERKVEKLSDDAVHRKTKNILEEYFSIKDKTELSECVKELDDPHHKEILVGEMLSVVEKKESDVEQMSGAIQHLEGEGLLDKASTLNAFKTFMENYDDLTIDVPQAHKYVAQLLIAFKLSPSDVGGEEFAALEKAYAGLKNISPSTKNSSIIQ